MTDQPDYVSFFPLFETSLPCLEEEKEEREAGEESG